MHGVLVFVTSMKNSMLNWMMLAHAFNPIILEAVSVSNTSLSLSARLYRYTEKLCLEIFFKKSHFKLQNVYDISSGSECKSKLKP